ncbi:MAG TPA: arginase family protein, partial [Planctomycetota bacterium]|nr:arginase family protein [Planctomycetota bacterium]
VPFGAIQACAEHYGEIGVLHFDAHADLRPAYEGFEWSHASIMHNVASKLSRVTRIVQVGLRDFSEQEYEQIRASNGAIRAVFDRDWSAALFEGEDPRKIIREHLALLPQHVFVSFDIDGLDPAMCPNTGTPVPGGLSWREANLWLDELAKGERRVVGVDLNEVNPGSAGADEDAWDAIIGARLLYRLIGTALATRGRAASS